MRDTIDEVDIGEEFEQFGYIHLKLDEFTSAPVWDSDLNEWKRPREVH